MDVPGFLHGLMQEAILSDRNAAFSRQEAAERGAKWAVVLGLEPVQDGNMFWLSWGGMPEGVNAFAATPEQCIAEFEKAMAASAIAPPRKATP